MAKVSSISCLITLSLLQVVLADWQNPRLPTCEERSKAISAANASSTFTIPGLERRNNNLTVSSNSSLAWNIITEVYRNASSLVTDGGDYLTLPAGQPEQLNGTSSSYVVCRYSFFAIRRPAQDFGREDGTCSSLTTPECARDLKSYMEERATAWAPGFPDVQRDTPGYTEPCQDVWNAIDNTTFPASCGGLRGVLDSGIVSLAEQDEFVLPTQASCPGEIGRVVHDERMFDNNYSRSLAAADAPEVPENYAVYDAALRSVNSHIFLRFENTGAEDELIPRLLDASLVCTQAANVRPGSRTPTENSTSDVRVSEAMSGRAPWQSAVYVVLLACMIGLVLV